MKSDLILDESSQNLDRLIRASHLNATQICEIAGGISPSFLSQLRRGRRPLNVFHASAIARTLQITLEMIHPTFRLQVEMLDPNGLQQLEKINSDIDARLADIKERMNGQALAIAKPRPDFLPYSRAVFEAPPGCFFIKSPNSYRQIKIDDYTLVSPRRTATTTGFYVIKMGEEHLIRKISVKSNLGLVVYGDDDSDITNIHPEHSLFVFQIVGLVLEVIRRESFVNFA